MSTEGIINRLKGARVSIERILSTSGTAGLSYGVIHEGQVIHMENFGYRDVEKKLPMNDETLMPICSMTKGLVTSVLGILVEEGKVKWDGVVGDVLPSYRPRFDRLAKSATIADFLSMRSGVEGYNMWTQNQNHVIFPESASMEIINNLRMATDLRATFDYNNWGYVLAAEVIRQVSGQSYATLLHEKIFEPLGLSRTDAKGDRDKFDNQAEAYMALDDGTPVHVKGSDLSAKTLMGPAGGVKSCVKDLLQLYLCILRSSKHEFTGRTSSTPGSPFKQLSSTMSAHMQFPGNRLRESTYGLGWIRTQLPNIWCPISPNYGLLQEAPVIGGGSLSKLVIAHYGSMPGAYTGVALFPETDSAIVLLTNSTPMCDIADWMSQFLTQIVFDFPEKVDYQHWVQRTVDAERQWYPGLIKELKSKQKPGTTPRNLDNYAGRYRNRAGFFVIEIARLEGGLFMAFQESDIDTFVLHHYQDDTFSWLMPRNELAKRGRPVLQPASYFLFEFVADGSNVITELKWQHDSRLEAEAFIKE